MCLFEFSIQNGDLSELVRKSD